MRPLYEYRVRFLHPSGASVEIPAIETTPCRAKNTALTRHAALLRHDATLPQDNRWRVGAVLNLRQVGFTQNP